MYIFQRGLVFNTFRVQAVLFCYIILSNDLIAGHYQTNVRAVPMNYVMSSSVMI